MSNKVGDGLDDSARLSSDVARRAISHYANDRRNSSGDKPGHESSPIDSSGADGNPFETPQYGMDGMGMDGMGNVGGNGIDLPDFNADGAGAGRRMGDINTGGNYDRGPSGYNNPQYNTGEGPGAGSGGAEGGYSTPTPKPTTAPGSGAAAGSAVDKGAAAGTKAAGDAGATAHAAAGAGTAAAGSGEAGAAGAGAAAAGAGGAAAGGGGCAIAILAVVAVALLFVIVVVAGIAFLGGMTYFKSDILKTKEGTMVEITENTQVYKRPGGTDTLFSNPVVFSVSAGGTYTYKGTRTFMLKKTKWVKIVYDIEGDVGWIPESSSKLVKAGDNQVVLLANSIIKLIAEDCQERVEDAKEDVSQRSSAYGNRIPLCGPNYLGGAMGMDRGDGKEFEYEINDGGLSAYYSQSSNTVMNGYIDIDVPYIMGIVSYYYEKNNLDEGSPDVDTGVDVITVDVDVMWEKIKELLEDILKEIHDVDVQTTPHTYTWTEPNPNYGEIIDYDTHLEYDAERDAVYEVKDPIYDEREYITRSVDSYYYSYNVNSRNMYEEINKRLNFSEEDYTSTSKPTIDEDFEVILDKTVGISELLYELGGLTFPGKLSEVINSDEEFDYDKIDFGGSAPGAEGSIYDYETGEEIIYDASGVTYKWPVPSCHSISSPFGWRVHPVHGTRRFHKGIDIPCGKNSDVCAIADGIVVRVYSGCTHNNKGKKACGCGGGFGNYVFIDHGNGLVSKYAHLTKPYNVKVGQKVVKGQVIGKSGTTGTSTGFHLHFQVEKNGTPVNPLNYVTK